VTGFGLIGHCWEMAERSGVRLRIAAERVPLYPGALAAARAGTRTAGDARNRAYLAGHAEVATDEALEALAYDPQTSGGLLAAVDADVVEDLAAAGFVAIGTVAEGAAAVELR
jgi:selenide,water dikinase